MTSNNLFVIYFRKRKASSPLEESERKMRNTKSWEVDTNIKGILHDMGVDYLSQTSTDSCESNSENTPLFIKDDLNQDSGSSFHLPPVPGVNINTSFVDNISLISFKGISVFVMNFSCWNLVQITFEILMSKTLYNVADVAFNCWYIFVILMIAKVC